MHIHLYTRYSHDTKRFLDERVPGETVEFKKGYYILVRLVAQRGLGAVIMGIEEYVQLWEARLYGQTSTESTKRRVN